MKLIDYYRANLTCPDPIIARDLAMGLRSDSVQSKKIVIVAKTGAGKSTLAGNLMEDFARWSSLIDHDDFDHTGEYWDMKTNMACIDVADIQNLLKRATKKYAGYLFDDIGYGWSNRKWNTDKNMVMNGWLGIQRTDQNLLVFTIPSDRFWDVQARSYCDIYIEVTGPSFFKEHINTAKVFYITLNPRDKHDPTHYEFPVIGRTKYKKFVFAKPSQEFTDYYEPIRAAKAKGFAEKEFDKIEKTVTAERPPSKRKQVEALLASVKDITNDEVAKRTGARIEYITNIRSILKHQQQ